MKQKLIELKRKMDKSKLIVGDFNASLLGDRTNRNTRKKIENFNNTVNQLGLINIYKIVQSTKTEYNSFDFPWNNK